MEEENTRAIGARQEVLPIGLEHRLDSPQTSITTASGGIEVEEHRGDVAVRSASGGVVYRTPADTVESVRDEVTTS